MNNIGKLKWRKINTCVWVANLIDMWDIKIDILIVVDGDMGGNYFRICVDQNVDNAIMYNLGGAHTMKAAKELAQKEAELFVKRNFYDNN